MKITRSAIVNTVLGVVIAGAIAASLLILLPAQANTSTDATRLTSTVQQGVVSSTITASGSVAAVREVAADFAVAGIIATVDVGLGATVTAGQQLGTLVTTDLDEAVTDAATALTRAKADLVTAKSALSTATSEAASADAQSASQAAQSLTSAQTQVTDATDKVADANDVLVDAQTNRAAATLTAPIAGLVVAVDGTVGASSGSGGSTSASASGDAAATTTTSGFMTIADVSAMTITAAIAEADIAIVSAGQPTAISFPALTDVATTATVTAIAPTGTASNSVVTYSTTITLDSIPAGLRLGQTAEATITTASSAEDALYVPTAAITTAADGTSTVDVVGSDDEVTTTTVETGVVGDAGTEIVSGVAAGDTIVLGEVAATTGTSDTDTGTGGADQGGFGGNGSGGFTPPSGGTLPGGTR
jgi:macrolide-specific efflux system membrane fusion protein